MKHKIPPFTKYSFKSRSKSNCRVCGSSISKIRLPPMLLEDKDEGSYNHIIMFLYNSALCSRSCWIKLSNSNENLIDELYQFIEDIQYEFDLKLKK